MCAQHCYMLTQLCACMYCVCRITSCYKLLVWLLLLNLGACTKQLSRIRTHLHACEVTIKFILNICKEIKWQSTPICTNTYVSYSVPSIYTHISVWLPCQLSMIGMVLTISLRFFPMNFSPPKGFCSGFLFPLIHVEPA